MKCHDSPLYGCSSLDSNISVTGDEDGFVKMWNNRQGVNNIMTFKRFDEFELNCMGTVVRSGTKFVVGSGTGPRYMFRYLLFCQYHCTPVSTSRFSTKLVS